MAGWWFEAYTLPHEAGGVTKIAEQLPVQDWSFEENKDRARSTIKFGIPRAHPFFDVNDIFTVDPEDHSNDLGSLVVAYNQDHVDGSNVPLPVQSFFLARRPDQTSNVQESVVDFSGRHLLTALDHFYVYPYDYPVDPSQVMDWKYGAGSILTNPGFEDGNPQSERWYVWIDGASSGTFELRSGLEITDPIPWDATATDIKDAIEQDFAWVISVSVTGSGTEESPFYITVTDPSGEDVFDLFLDANNTDGDVHVGVDLQGGALDISGWTRSVNISTQSSEYGRYASDGFRLSQAGEPVRTGNYSLRINGLDIYTGAMQAVDVIPGQRYRGSIWVYTSSTTDVFRLVIRTVWDEFIASSHGLSGVSVPPNTWTEFAVDFVVPEFINTIVFRFAVVGVNNNPGEQGNPTPFYLDDASLSPGAPPSNMGVIWNELMDDIQVDHSADPRGTFGTWINRTWDDTNDSNGVPWIQEHSITIREGMTYLQFVEECHDRFGYKFDMWLDPSDMEIYMGISQDGGESHAADDAISLVIGKDIVSGELVKSEATATDVFARGADGLWAESGDTTLRSRWDRREKFIRDLNLTSGDDLTLAAQTELSRLADAMLGMKFEMMDVIGGDTKPFVHFRTWDRINVEPGSASGIGKAARSVESIKVDGNGGNASTITLNLSSEVFGSTGFAAQAEAVRRLVRMFLFHMPHPQEGGTSLALGGGGGIPDVVLAANDTLFTESADLIAASYSSDDEMLLAALALLPDNGGWIHLLEGTYTFSDQVTPETDLKLTGAGEGATTILLDPSASVTAVLQLGSGLDGNNTFILEDFTVDGNGGTTSEALIFGQSGTVPEVYITRVRTTGSSHHGIQSRRSVGNWYLTNVVSDNNASDGFFMQECSVLATGIRAQLNGANGYRCAHGGFQSIVGSHFIQNTDNGIGSASVLNGGNASMNIVGNIISDNGGNGVSQAPTSGIPVLVVGNRITDNGGQSVTAVAGSVIGLNYYNGNGTDEPNIEEWGSGGGGAETVTFSSQPSTELVVGSGSFRFVAPVAGTIIGVRAALGDAATGDDVIVDVNKNGSTIFTTQANRPSVADGTNVGAEAVPDVTAIAENDWFTVDVDQIGSTYGGADLTVTLQIEWEPEE